MRLALTLLAAALLTAGPALAAGDAATAPGGARIGADADLVVVVPPPTVTLLCQFRGPACLYGEGLLCGRATGGVIVEDALGPAPRFRLGGREYRVSRVRNFYGTVYEGWQNHREGFGEADELWLRDGGGARWIARGDPAGIGTRAEFSGRCRPL